MHNKGKYTLTLKNADGTKQQYELRVMQIKSRHEDGSPKDCIHLLDRSVINLEGGEEFMTCFVPCCVLGNEGTG